MYISSVFRVTNKPLKGWVYLLYCKMIGRAYFKLCFMHKVVHKSAPDYLVDVLPNVANAEKHYNLEQR